MKIVTVDQGTTSTKALLVTEDGASTGLGAIRHDQHYPQPGWLEHDAGALLANVQSLLEAGAASGATAMALANQGETVVAWNRRTGEPLAPAIVWQDQRTEAAVGALRDAGLEGEVQSLSGLPLESYFSATKLRWLLDNVDGAAALARQGMLGLGTSDSYFIERLTGRYLTDVTTASRTSLMNLDTLGWDPRLCDIFGVPQEVLPEIAPETEPLGEIATPHGKVTLHSSVVDQIAALYGHGCRGPGEGKVTVGTGAFALVLTGTERPADLAGGSIPTAAWAAGSRRAYAADGAVYTAAAAVEWLVRIGLLDHAGALSALSWPSAASRGIYFVPALSGLACPHWDRSATGLFIGMDAATEREDLVKAVLEGVAFRIAEVMDTLGMAGGENSPVSLDGGLTRSAYFLQFLSDMSGRVLSSCGEAEVTALGAAWLGLAKARGADPATVPALAGVERSMTRPGTDARDSADFRGQFGEAVSRSRRWRKAD